MIEVEYIFALTVLMCVWCVCVCVCECEGVWVWVCVCVFQHIFTNEDQMSHKHRKIRKILHSENISLLLLEFILGLGLGFMVVIRMSVEVTLG